MTSAISPSAQNPQHSATNASATASGTTSPLPGAVPAQLPVRSYANATKTASAAAPTPAGASTQNAKSTESPVNGANTTAHGGSQPNGANTHEHGRKPSVVINASGASGSIPNGGPVGQNGRPHINFGAMNASPLPQHSAPYQNQTSSLPAPRADPRVISPAHSPSPIPQPQASGGRPPAGLGNQTNSMTFGQLGGEGDQFRQGQPPLGPGMPAMHERRQSSQSMHSDMSSSNMPNMNRGFVPPGGRGRGYPPQGYNGMPSPGPGYRPMPGGQPQARPGMHPQYQPPGSPYLRSNSPAMRSAQPNMQYGYQPHMNQHQQQMYQQFDPYSGYYQPYQYGQYPGAQPQSPRPPYPSPYGGPQQNMQPPFNPPDMSRTPSQSSQRPPSSMGQPQTPSLPNQMPTSQTPVSQPGQAQQSAAFVRPQKRSNAIKITDANGNEVNFGKPSPSPSTQAPTPAPTQARAPSQAPQTPVIVSTPNAPTPPPRAPSSQQARPESKSPEELKKAAEEKKNAFQEQVKKQLEEEKRKKQEEADAKTKTEKAEPEPKVEEKKPEPVAEKKVEDDEKAAAEAKIEENKKAEAAAENQIKEATAEAEKAAAIAAKDKEGEKDAKAAEAALEKPAEEKTEKEETEDERMEREIAEMEAADKAEEERERAFQEKKKLEKEEAAKRQKEVDAKADEELKRQEREAEEREEAREREREAEHETEEKQTEEPDDEAKSMFASLKKPTLGPGASAESGTETPASEKEETPAAADSAAMPPPQQPASTQPRAGAQKPKPAHLKLETNKRVEPAEPTPGMQALKSARFLEVKEEAMYPEGIMSPNPAANLAARKGRAYDVDFLKQFQNVFKEKPSVDWDQKVKETLGPGDEPQSARAPGSARTPSGMSRQTSGRPGAQGGMSFVGGAMGQFSGPPGRTLPAGTTSEQRFAAASGAGGQRGGMAMPGQMGRMPSNLGMNAPMAMNSRTNSLQTMGNIGGPNSPRQPSNRGGRGGSKRGMSRKEEADMANKMPLTAHMEVAPLQASGGGWKPTSIGQAPMAGPDPSGSADLMAPDMVQRKVKAALNKMTPEKFDKISDQVLAIASQSKHESDGRTLRQVIQLTFEKATDEAHWAGMYARFCHKMLTAMSPDIRDETIKDKNGNPVVGGALFRKYLLNRCQEEFERGWQANLPDKPEGDSKEAALLSDEYYIAAAAKRRGLGLIQFIGQLYKLKMLTLRIMHECVMRLLNFEGEPDEAAVENMTTLLGAVGSTMDEDDQGRNLMSTYFQRIDEVLLKNDSLPSRSRFMIMDLVDLRKAGWRGKNDGSKGPKTLDQIHAEAAAAQAKAEAERARTNVRGGHGGGRMPPGRGDARQFSGGMPPPVDHTRTTVGMDDLRRLQNRGSSQRQTGGGLGPGGSLGPSSLSSGRAGSRRGNLGPPSSGNTTRTSTPPVDDKKKDEPQAQQNAFSALAALDPSGEDAGPQSGDTSSPPAARNRSKSPMPAERTET